MTLILCVRNIKIIIEKTYSVINGKKQLTRQLFRLVDRTTGESLTLKGNHTLSNIIPLLTQRDFSLDQLKTAEA